MTIQERYKYLYDTTPKVYTVDPIFLDYISTEKSDFDTRLDLGRYLQKINGSTIATKHYYKFPVATTNPEINVTERSSYNHDVLDYSFSFQFGTTAYTSTEISEIGARLNNVMLNSSIKSDTDLNNMSVSTLLDSFEKHMMAFHTALNLESFQKLLEEYKKNTASTYSIAQNEIATAVRNAGGVTQQAQATRLRLLKVEEQGAYFAIIDSPAVMLGIVSNAALKALTQLSIVFGRQRIREFLTVFVDREKMGNIDTIPGVTSQPNTKQKWYMLLYGTMLKYLDVPANMLPPDINSIYRTKCTLVDAFIKACYPLIQYYTINVMTEMYRRQGDMVNARHGVIAKAVFSFHTINALNSLAYRASPRVTLPTLLTTDFTAKIESFIRIISRPMVIPGNADPENLSSQVMRGLQNKSESVVKASESIEVLKASISKNQLALRSITLANTNNSRAMFWRRTEMIVLFVLLMSVLIIASVLYLMDKAFLGFMISSILLAVILLYLLVIYIIKFLKSST